MIKGSTKVVSCLRIAYFFSEIMVFTFYGKGVYWGRFTRNVVKSRSPTVALLPYHSYCEGGDAASGRDLAKGPLAKGPPPASAAFLILNIKEQSPTFWYKTLNVGMSRGDRGGGI